MKNFVLSILTVFAFTFNACMPAHAKMSFPTIRLEPASTPGGPEEGEVYYDNTAKNLQFYNGSIWQEIGTGSGGAFTKLLVDLDFDAEVPTDVTTYADAAGAVPVDGSGGSPTLTATLETSSELDGDGSMVIAKDAANRQGEGFCFDLPTISDTHQDKRHVVTFDYQTSANYVDDDIAFFFVADDADPVSAVNGRDFFAEFGNGLTAYNQTTKTATWTGSFTFSENAKVCGHVASTNANAYTVIIDNLKIGLPGTEILNFLTDWEAFTPTTTWVSNVGFSGYKRRVGSNLEMVVRWVASGAPTGVALKIDLPDNLTIDSTAFNNSSVSAQVGEVTLLDSGVLQYMGTGRVTSADYTVIEVMAYLESSTDITYTSVSHINPFTWGSPDAGWLRVSVPIEGWSSGNVQPSYAIDIDRLKVQATISTVTHTSNNNFQDVAWTETKDTHGAFDGTTFTAPVTGDYTFTGVLGWGSNVTGHRAVQLVYSGGGNPFAYNLPTITTGGGLLGPIAQTIELQAGETIKIQAFQNSGGNLAYSTGSFLQITAQSKDKISSGLFTSDFESIGSSAFDLTTAGYATGEWAQMTGNSLTLGPGRWAVNGYLNYIHTTATITTLQGRWSTANGDNTTSTPTELNTVCTVEGGSVTSINTKINTGGTSFDDTFLPVAEIVLNCPQSFTVYHNFRSVFSSVTTALVSMALWARRLP